MTQIVERLIEPSAAYYEDLFPDLPDSYYSAGVENIAAVARNVVEYIHDARPDAVVAADRGGRLLALATYASWSHRFPGERFPTRDGKLYFARISTTLEEDAGKAARAALIRAGILPVTSKRKKVKEGPDTTLLLIDDWVGTGRTFDLFSSVATTDFGISEPRLAMASMYSNRLERPGVTHILGDAGWNGRGSEWDGNETILGIYYNNAMPNAAPNDISRKARADLHKNVDRYYKKFNKALAAGKISACNCLDLNPVGDEGSRESISSRITVHPSDSVRFHRRSQLSTVFTFFRSRMAGSDS